MSDPHQEGTPAGIGNADVERRSRIAEALGKEVWPADRDALVAKARESNAPDDVLSALQRLSAGQTYENVQEVAAALGLGTEQQRF
jgi:Protein of unknown function (DUF2795)